MYKIWKFDEVKAFIEVESKSDCVLLTVKEEYKNTKEKLKIKCKCGQTYYCSFNQFKSQNKTSCNDCSKNRQSIRFRKNIYEIINYIDNPTTGNGCKFISGDYINNESKLNIKCSCGNIFITDFRTFKFSSKKQCNECGFKRKGQDKKIPFRDVKSFIEMFNCELVTTYEDYKNAGQRLDIKCSCGNLFQNSFSLFKYGKTRRCNECYRKESSERNSIPYSEIKRYVEIDSESGCKFLTKEDEYVNTHSTVKLQCKCGEIFSTSIHEFKSGNKRQCNCCGIGLMKTIDFINMFNNNELVNNCQIIEYEDNDGFIHSRSIVKIKCSCGEIFETKRSHFTYNDKKRCDKCSSKLTKGEERVKKFLDTINFKFIREFSFDNCRGVRKPLPFDFAVFNNQGNLSFLIEYDGEQHFHPVNFGGCSDEVANKEHEDTKRNDQIKNTYCKDNNIPLIRIPYWDFDNIEQILTCELNKYQMYDEII